MTETRPLTLCNQIIPAHTLVEVRDGGEWVRGLTTGAVSVGDGVLSNLWVSKLDDPSPVGYLIQNIRIVRS